MPYLIGSEFGDVSTDGMCSYNHNIIVESIMVSVSSEAETNDMDISEANTTPGDDTPRGLFIYSHMYYIDIFFNRRVYLCGINHG